MPTAPEIPEHRLLRPIGGGAYGEVWLARSELGERRAVKIIRRERFNAPEPFARELAGVRLFEPISRQHEGLVDILQFGQREGTGFFYYVMELADACVPGASDETYTPRTLGAVVKAGGPLPALDAARIFAALADGLAFLHAHELVHRDLKPSNVIFVEGAAKLADIGSVSADDSQTSLVGTTGYLPPEGGGTASADIFALGRMLYEAATGEDRQRFALLPPARLLAPDTAQLLQLNTIWLRACAERPADRHPSAAAFASDLRAVLDGQDLRRSEKMTRRVVLGTLLAGAVGAGSYALRGPVPAVMVPPPEFEIARFGPASGPVRTNAGGKPWNQTTPGIARIGEEGFFLDGGDSSGPAAIGLTIPDLVIGPREGWHLRAEVRLESENVCGILLVKIVGTECSRCFALPLEGLKKGIFHVTTCPLPWNDPSNLTFGPDGRMLSFEQAGHAHPASLRWVSFGLPISDQHVPSFPRLAVTIRRLSLVAPGNVPPVPAHLAQGWSCYDAPRHVLPTPDGSPIILADLSPPPPERLGGEWKNATCTMNSSSGGLHLVAPVGHGFLDVNTQTLDFTPVSEWCARLRITLLPANQQSELHLHFDDPEFDNRIFRFLFAGQPVGSELILRAPISIGDPSETYLRNGQPVSPGRLNLRRIRKISLGSIHDSHGPLDVILHAIELVP